MAPRKIKSATGTARGKARAETKVNETPITTPTRQTCAVCGSRKLAEQYPIAMATNLPILITCSECLENVGYEKTRQAIANDIGEYTLSSKRKNVSTDSQSTSKKAKYEKPTTAECRICTEVKDLEDFPKATARLKKAARPTNHYYPPPPVRRAPPKDIPAECAYHLCAYKSNKAGAICKTCIGASMSGSLSYKAAQQVGCPDENCGRAWDAIDYVSKYLSNEDFTTFSKKLFDTYIATNKEIKWCPNTDCGAGGIVVNRLSANRGLPQMECSSCQTRMCINCNTAWHRDQTCQEYQLSKGDDKKSEDEIESLKQLVKLGARRCPHCAFAVEKIDGCPNMICGYCHLNFYWDSAEQVLSKPATKGKKNAPSKTGDAPAVQVPGYYQQQGCEADIWRESEATKRAEVAKGTNDAATVAASSSKRAPIRGRMH